MMEMEGVGWVEGRVDFMYCSAGVMPVPPTILKSSRARKVSKEARRRVFGGQGTNENDLVQCFLAVLPSCHRPSDF